jgi:hypothetical protein
VARARHQVLDDGVTKRILITLGLSYIAAVVVFVCDEILELF